MSNRPFLKAFVLFVPLLIALAGLHLLARAEAGQSTVYLPFIARSQTCSVPSTLHPTIQSAIDGNCTTIHLTAALYRESVSISGRSVTILGQGPAVTTIDGQGTYPVFTIESNGELRLESITVTNGLEINAWGGIENHGVTHLINTIITENHSSEGQGGGISSDGTLTVESSWITNNTLTPYSGSRGGGVYLYGFGSSHFNNTIISGNEADMGGGIYLDGNVGNPNLTLLNSQILDNETQFYGGGLANWSNGTVLISHTTLSNNVSGYLGGGIYNQRKLQILDSQIVGNVTGTVEFPASCGGGILSSSVEGSSLLIERTEVRNNVSMRDDGGGICVSGSQDEVEIYDSLIVGNSAADEGGGIYSTTDNFAVVQNTTFFNNSATVRGGAISALYLQLVNVTISQNSAPEGSSIYSGQDVQLVNTIVTGGLSGSNCAAAPSAAITSLGHNIAGDNTCNLNGPGDLPGADPLLGPLQDNGGSTHTMALQPGSPAIDSADNNACPPTDQRGVHRPQGPACDMGAYEAEA
jgi:predicted outer membrane repeat protein